jgi:hypothetical protein
MFSRDNNNNDDNNKIDVDFWTCEGLNSTYITIRPFHFTSPVLHYTQCIPILAITPLKQLANRVVVLYFLFEHHQQFFGSTYYREGGGGGEGGGT